MTERPVVHCLIARKTDDGHGFKRSEIVTLAEAYIALESGYYYVVGPDPEDMEALRAWEREHAPFNGPRIES